MFFKGIINFAGLLRRLPRPIVAKDQLLIKHRGSRYSVL